MCSSVLIADVPQHRQNPEPWLYPFQNLMTGRKRADVLHHMTKRYISLTSLLPSPTSQSALEFVIAGPDWEQIFDQLWDAGTRLQNTVWKQSLTSCLLAPWCLLKDHPRGKNIQTTYKENVHGLCSPSGQQSWTSASLSEAHSRPRVDWGGVLATQDTV